MKVDIVGCGAVVREYHVPALLRLQRAGVVDIRGCFDLDVKRAESIAMVVGAETSGPPESQVTLSPGAGVLVATPPASHASIATRYLEAGVNVFLEKPFTATAKEADQVIDLAATRQTRVNVNHFWRLYPPFLDARRLISERVLGDIHRIDATNGFRWDWGAGSGYVTQDPFGGVIHDMGAHLIDAVCYITGADRGGSDLVLKDLDKSSDEEPSHECRARLTLHSADHGVVEVSLGISRLQPLARGIKVHAEKGAMFIPLAPSEGVRLFLGGRPYGIVDKANDVSSRSVIDCFETAHRWFAEGPKGKAGSDLDGSRFRLGMKAIDQLWAGASS